MFRFIDICKRIIFDDKPDKYLISFDSYISYLAINESYDIGMSGEYSGNGIREYKQSAFIDFCKKETSGTKVLALAEVVAKAAADINIELKRRRKQIEMADLFIAATAIANNLPFATLNRKHFDRIDGLTIVE